MLAFAKKFHLREIAGQLLRDADLAVQLRAPAEVQAKFDEAQGGTVAKLLTALTDTSTALIQIGSLLVIKIDGVPVVRNLTRAEVAHLKLHPYLLHDLAGCLDSLRQAADCGYGTDTEHLPSGHHAALAGGSPTGPAGPAGPYGTASQ